MQLHSFWIEELGAGAKESVLAASLVGQQVING
jgi:hypothetical protein